MANPIRHPTGRQRRRYLKYFFQSHDFRLADTVLVYYSRHTQMHNDTPPLLIQPSSGVPIYRQLIDQIRALVNSGRMPAGTMLPSVRQISADLEVNVMTVSKAYARLEAEGVVERVRGTGMRVRGGQAIRSVSERQQQLKPTAEQLVAHARQLNLTEEQTLQAVRQLFRSTD